MFTTRPELLGTHGMVASTHWLGAQVGMAMLEAGGNAFDAAVAAGFTHQVVEPHLNGLGGDVPIIFQAAGDTAPRVLCGQGPAPAGATLRAYRDLDLDLVPGSGLVAAVVPLAFDAWALMLRDYGTMDLATVMAPAIHYARNGFPLVPGAVAAITAVRELFARHWPTSADLWLPGGEPPAPGALFRLPGLARTMERLAKAAGQGREADIDAARARWREGFVAEAIDAFVRGRTFIDDTGTERPGFLTGEDIARNQARYEEPVTLDYAGVTVCKTGPWGQGPVMLQALQLLKGLGIDTVWPDGPDFVHLCVEAMKLAMADRDCWYGDPDFVDVPLATLLSDTYADQRRALIGDEASLDFRPGSPDGRTPVVPDVPTFEEAERMRAAGYNAGEPTSTFTSLDPRREGDTCHIDVVDRWGNMVSATPSGGWLQSSPTIPELGFALGSRAQMFWLQEGTAAVAGGGRRPRTTLTPTLVTRDGKPILSLGTPGGDQQDQWSLVFLLRRLHHGMTLQSAIDAPMFHSHHGPASFWPRAARPGVVAIESRWSSATQDELVRRGHILEDKGDWALGRLSAVARSETKDGVLLKAGANPRFMQGYAVGR